MSDTEAASATSAASRAQAWQGGKDLDWPVFLLSGGLVTVFVLLALIDIDLVSTIVNASFAWSARVFGPYWQVLMLATFFVGIVLGFSGYGRIRIGGIGEPEMSTFKWVAIIMCTLLAGGGVFWSFAEPMYHFSTVPPAFSGIEAKSEAAIAPALAQSYLHWGFLAWAILGATGAIVLMYAHYHKGLPLKPRALLYPVFSEKTLQGPLGTVVDAFSIIAVAAGTIGPIGFLGLQLSYAFEQLMGIPDTYATQFSIVAGLVLVYTISAVSGIHRGITYLSNFNVVLGLVLGAMILLLGPGGWIINKFFTAFGVYVTEFITMSTDRSDSGWLGWWTIFFWGWFIGYGPMMAIFVARISRGRTIRELILALAIIAPIVTNFWFTVLGGAGIFYELQNAGSVSQALQDAGLPAAMLAITQQLPLASLMVPAFLVLIVIFLATTGDSMAYTIAVAVSGHDVPKPGVRIFWAVAMGAVAVILLRVGEGGISALQSFIVVSAVPISLILLPPLWTAPQLARRLAREEPHRVETVPV